VNRVLANFARQFDALDAEAQMLAETYPASVLLQRPAEGGWCVTECWDHVAKTVASYLPKIDSGISSGRAASIIDPGPYSAGLVGRVFLWMLEPPARMKVKAPVLFQPAPDLAPDLALQQYQIQHRELRERLWAANGLDLGRVKVISPATDKLKVPLLIAFGAMGAHGRRHNWQAQQILKKINA
jgi:hypothetical protein